VHLETSKDIFLGTDCLQVCEKFERIELMPLKINFTSKIAIGRLMDVSCSPEKLKQTD